MANADYTYYTGTYKGNVIPSTAFDRCITRAMEYLELITQDQAAIEVTYAPNVKMASCAVAEIEYRFADVMGKSSESVSGQSVNYDTATINRSRYAAAKRYLWQTELLYSGVD